MRQWQLLDEELMEVYLLASKYELSKDFIKMIRDEFAKRSLKTPAHRDARVSEG